jgi:hypothetical protein
MAESTLTAAVPKEVRISGFVEAVFKFTLPKASLLALKVNSAVFAAAPVPLRLTVLALPLEELLEILKVPLAALGLRTVAHGMLWFVLTLVLIATCPFAAP